MYRPTLQRIPLSVVFHITVILSAPAKGTAIVRDCCRFYHYTPSGGISSNESEIPQMFAAQTDYLLTLAPAPPMMPSTSSTVAMEVSPGVVIASAP